MEDALVQKNRVEDPKNYISLNPCFNGRCTRTKAGDIVRRITSSLNPCFNGRCTRTKHMLGDT